MQRWHLLHPPSPALGGTNPPNHGCPLHVPHSLQTFPNPHGIASTKVPLFSIILAAIQCKPPVCSPKPLPLWKAQGQMDSRGAWGALCVENQQYLGQSSRLQLTEQLLCADVTGQQAVCPCLPFYLPWETSCAVCADFPDGAAGSSQTHPSPCLS